LYHIMTIGAYRIDYSWFIDILYIVKNLTNESSLNSKRRGYYGTSKICIFRIEYRTDCIAYCNIDLLVVRHCRGTGFGVFGF
jgi:hypothetical protein